MTTQHSGACVDRTAKSMVHDICHCKCHPEAARLEAYVQRTVAAAPQLTREQASKIAVLMDLA